MRISKSTVFVSNTESEKYFTEGSFCFTESAFVAAVVMQQEDYVSLIHNLVEKQPDGSKFLLASKTYILTAKEAVEKCDKRSKDGQKFLICRV